jgi:dihydrofolate synthase/folylpolyglutamate synthase
VLRRAYEIGAFAIRGHSDYLVDRHGEGWSWREPGFEIALPMPALVAPVQLDNAAAAIAALRALPLELPDAALVEGVRSAQVPGRLQVVASSPEVVVDVAHNPQAAAQLAGWLRAHPKRTRAVFGALRDKDVAAVVATLDPLLLEWHLAGIHDAGARGGDAAGLAQRMAAQVESGRLREHHDAAAALRAALAASSADERVLVFGSFHIVADALRDAGALSGKV